MKVFQWHTCWESSSRTCWSGDCGWPLPAAASKQLLPKANLEWRTDLSELLVWAASCCNALVNLHKSGSAVAVPRKGSVATCSVCCEVEWMTRSNRSSGGQTGSRRVWWSSVPGDNSLEQFTSMRFSVERGNSECPSGFTLTICDFTVKVWLDRALRAGPRWTCTRWHYTQSFARLQILHKIYPFIYSRF